MNSKEERQYRDQIRDRSVPRGTISNYERPLSKHNEAPFHVERRLNTLRINCRVPRGTNWLKFMTTRGAKR